jgi:hypothetical protein
MGRSVVRVSARDAIHCHTACPHLPSGLRLHPRQERRKLPFARFDRRSDDWIERIKELLTQLRAVFRLSEPG